nr:RUN and FYVE domain-containing protein 1-like [Biomphalaria glabrata]
MDQDKEQNQMNSNASQIVKQWHKFFREQMKDCQEKIDAELEKQKEEAAEVIKELTVTCNQLQSSKELLENENKKLVEACLQCSSDYCKKNSKN